MTPSDDVEPGAIWGVRGVDPEIRRRVAVLAVLRHVTVGQIVQWVLLEWLSEGAPGGPERPTHLKAH